MGAEFYYFDIIKSNIVINELSCTYVVIQYNNGVHLFKIETLLLLINSLKYDFLYYMLVLVFKISIELLRTQLSV